MKFLIAISFLFPATSFASNCPVFSGDYFLRGVNAIANISQIDCKLISITLSGAGTETRIADGKFREVTDPRGQILYTSTFFSETRLIMEQMDSTKNFIETRSNFRKAGNNLIASDFYYNKAGDEIGRSGALFEKIVK
jgi:hypothetical protein